MRYISFSMTTEQIRAGTKDVTRRLGWLHAKPGQLLMPALKCMGLKPGERIVALRAPIRLVDVRREPLRMMTDDLDYGLEEIRREGFEGHLELGSPIAWVEWFCRSHRGCEPGTVITRLQFEYTDGGDAC